MINNTINKPNPIITGILINGDVSLSNDPLIDSVIGSEMSDSVFPLNMLLKEDATLFALFFAELATLDAAFFILFTGAATNEPILANAPLFEGFDVAFILLDDTIDCYRNFFSFSNQDK